MKLVNNSSKIINIGTTVLMPDADMPIDAKTAALPSIMAMVKMKQVKVIEDAPAKTDADGKEDNAAPAQTDDSAKKPTAPKKSAETSK